MERIISGAECIQVWAGDNPTVAKATLGRECTSATHALVVAKQTTQRRYFYNTANVSSNYRQNWVSSLRQRPKSSMSRSKMPANPPLKKTKRSRPPLQPRSGTTYPTTSTPSSAEKKRLPHCAAFCSNRNIHLSRSSARAGLAKPKLALAVAETLVQDATQRYRDGLVCLMCGSR